MAGQGKIGVANGVMGLYPAKGTVEFNGEKLELNNPKYPLDNSVICLFLNKKPIY